MAPRPVSQTYPVETPRADSRLDRFLCEKTPAFVSKKAAYKAVKRGEIHVNGEPVGDPQYRLHGGDVVTVWPDTREPPPPLRLTMPVVFEDDVLAVVEKPPGLPVSGNYAKTVQRALPYNLSASHAPDALRIPRPVHRLDAPTGGLLLVAKTAGALVDLSQQFETRAVRKIYHAVTAGSLPDSVTVTQPLDEKHAETFFQTLARAPSLNYTELCLVACQPHTGRTHQIRRHLQALGAPIVGDLRYGDAGHVLKGKGLFLWAVGLAFRHPVTDDSVDVTVQTPRKFAALMTREARRTRLWRGE
ncbi:MAG: RluA family pseudouridine synthase [Lentisphaeria bacterium]|nr:RluA family pseudouridine synthase [Lentisphaeria bacterium]